MKNKLILDFDGIFAADMLYNTEGKALKSFPWGIRHSIDLLTQHGFEVYIITGDSTEFGQAISARFTKNLKIKEIIFVHSQDKLTTLRNRFNLDECIYAGDDIFDIEIFKQCYSILPYEAHHIFASHVDYISKYTPRNYFFMDMALHILHRFIFNEEIPLDTLSQYLVKESAHQPLNRLLLDQRYQRVFILQQYSMRNHTDGMYNPLLDGNLNLTLHRIYNAIQQKPKMQVFLTIPDNVDEEQFKILERFVSKYYDSRIKFIKIKYGLNALENRKKFGDTTCLEPLVKDKDLIISDFELAGFNVIQPVIYTFNISKIAELERWYVDEFFDDQWMRAIRTDDFVYVLNENQKEYMVAETQDPLNKLAIQKNVIVDDEIINEKLFDYQYEFFLGMLDDKVQLTIEEELYNISYANDKTFFLPFRLTDECYNFKGILWTLKQYPDKKFGIIVTNPNDGEILENIPENVTIINIAEKFESVNKKSLYYKILGTIRHMEHVMIPIYENPETVLHQSLIEMELVAPRKVNFINKNSEDCLETLCKNVNNNYIKKIIYGNNG